MQIFDRLTASAAPAREMQTLDRLRADVARGGGALAETMKHRTTLNLLAASIALGVTGCASTPTPPDSSDSHPANAEAAQGAVPPPVPLLMNVTNMVIVKPAIEPAPEHRLGHEQHESKSKTEEEK